jgi:hypothetical protein
MINCTRRLSGAIRVGIRSKWAFRLRGPAGDGGHPGRVVKVGKLSQDVLVVSVLRTVDGASVHRYRLVGGPDDGREFATLAEVFDYARKHLVDAS